jgi:hypothetical protein
MQDDIKPQNIKMWTKYTHTKHMLHILIYIDDKLGGIGSECKKMINTEDMGITSLVNILGGNTCDTVSFFQHP